MERGWPDSALSADARIADLLVVLEVSRQLGATTDLKSVLNKIEQSAREVLNCERATVFLYDQKSDELYSRIATGVDEIRFPASQGIAGEVFGTSTAINVRDVYDDGRFNREIDRKTGYRTRNMLAFPLLGLDGEAVGVLQVLNKRVGDFTAWDEDLVKTFGAQVGVAVQRQLLLGERAEKERLKYDLQIARRIQQSVLPAGAPAVCGFDIAGWNQPADETGGDFFDFQELDGGSLAMTVADATGHGIGPALVAAECRALLRAALCLTGDLDRVLGLVNRLISDDLPDGRFVTAFFGLLAPEEGRLDFISAGQGPLLFYDARKKRILRLPIRGIPWGVMEAARYGPPDRVSFESGDVLLLFTDGFFEWSNPGGALFGVERVIDLLGECHRLSAAEIIAKLHGAVLAFARGTPQSDDLTAVVVKKL